MWGSDGCTVAGVGVLPHLALGSSGLCVKRDGGCRYAGDCGVIGVCGVRVRLGGVAGCTAAGVGALSLVLASDGLCMKRDGGCRYARDCAVKRQVWCASMARGSGGLRSRVCGFMHRDEGAEHRKTGERETAGNTPVRNKCPECYTEDRQGQKISAFGRVGRCWKIWIFIDLTKFRQSFLSVLTI